MRSVYRVLAFVIAAEIAVQAAAIAYAASGLASWVSDGGTYDKAVMEDGDSGVTGAAGLVLHGVNGMIVVPLLAVAVLGTTLVQVGLGVAAEGAPVLGAVHGLLALVLFGLAVMAGKRVGSVTSVERRTSPL